MTNVLSISELLQLQSTLRKEANNTQSIVSGGAFVEKNGDIDTESVSVKELNEAIAKLDELDFLSILVADKLHEANRGTKFVHTTGEGKAVELNLASALDYVKQIRTKASLFERLGRAKKVTVQTPYGSTERIVTERLYDIDKYAKLANELGKEANRLSREIERQSVSAMVEVEGVQAYL